MNTMKDKTVFGNLLLTLVICAIMLPLYLVGRLREESAAFEVTNFLIIAASAFGMTRSTRERPFCSSTFFYTFVLFFFGVAPLMQYMHYTTFWGGKIIDTDVFAWLNVIILMILATYELSYRVLYSHLEVHKPPQLMVPTEDESDAEEPLNIGVLCLMSLVVTVFTFWYYSDDISFMVIREVAGAEPRKFETENQSLHLVFIHFLRPIPVIAWTLYNFCTPKRRWYVSLTLGTLALISNFPLSLSRNYLAAVYIPLVCSLMKTWIRKKYVIIAILAFAMLYFFPLMNQNRTIGEIDEFKFAMNFRMFRQGHFDSYQNFARIISMELVTNGRQLLGCLFFFVPRSIWPDKPIGSGGFIADMFDYEFSHISMPYFAEGYINFSYFGILLFTLLLGMLNAYMDFRYYNRKNGIRFKLIYLTYCSMLIFNMRGDLISCYAYSVGFLCSIAFVCGAGVSRHGKNLSDGI